MVGLRISVPRSKGEVQEAILQFAARRSHHLLFPWFTYGPRIEMRDGAGAEAPHRAERSAGLLAWIFRVVFDQNPAPRVDLTLTRKMGKTQVNIELGSNQRSVELAYALRAYLSHDRAYRCLCPPVCPVCGTPVSVILARYCGRCGKELLAGATGDPPRPAIGEE